VQGAELRIQFLLSPIKHTALSKRPLLCCCENGVEPVGPVRGGRCTLQHLITFCKDKRERVLRSLGPS